MGKDIALIKTSGTRLQVSPAVLLVTVASIRRTIRVPPVIFAKARAWNASSLALLILKSSPQIRVSEDRLRRHK